MNTSKKSITFLLTSTRSIPVGGYKVVYEYANRLVKDGYDVSILYPLTFAIGRSFFREYLKALPRYIRGKIKGVSGRKWFNLDSRVKEKLVLSLNWRDVPHKSDFYIAPSCRTSYYLNQYPIPKGNKLYLIQDFENWGVPDEFVYNSYKFGLKNIVISNWLAEKVKSTNSPYTLIKNGFDFDYFKLSKPIDQRDRYIISMLYHNAPRKGCKYGLEALTRLRERYPQLKVMLFGVPERPKDLPEWIEYYQTPDKEKHNQIYNESAIYMAPSLVEGWGLTVGEAMICGATIVCTDALGFHEMVENEKNGLIVSSGDSTSLEKAIIRLIENDDLRIKLAKQGNSDIQSFSWDNSYIKLKNLIES